MHISKARKTNRPDRTTLVLHMCEPKCLTFHLQVKDYPNIDTINDLSVAVGLLSFKCVFILGLSLSIYKYKIFRIQHLVDLISF